MATTIITKSQYDVIASDAPNDINVMTYTGPYIGSNLVTPVQIEFDSDFTLEPFRNQVNIDLYDGSTTVVGATSTWRFKSIPDGTYNIKAGEKWLFSEGIAPSIALEYVPTIKSADYTDFGTSSGHDDWINVNGFTGTTVLNTTSAIAIEIKTDTHIVPWNGTLSLTVHEGSTEHKWALTGQGANPFDVKVGETWVFEDGKEPKLKSLLKINGKTVESISIEGKKVKSLMVGGKKFTFVSAPLPEGDYISDTEYSNAVNNGNQLINVFNYTGSLTGTTLDTKLTVKFSTDLKYSHGFNQTIKLFCFQGSDTTTTQLVDWKWSNWPTNIWEFKAGETWTFEQGKAPVRFA